MDSLEGEVLLFSLELSPGANQKNKNKKKDVGVFFKKGNFWITNVLANLVKKNVRYFKVWSLIFYKIPLKTTKLFSMHFLFGLSLSILYFPFQKGKDTSAIPQPSIHLARKINVLKVFSNFTGKYLCWSLF